jgi:hypothetical protein
MTPPITIITVVKRPREGRRPALRGRGGVEEVIGGNSKPESRSPKESRNPKSEGRVKCEVRGRAEDRSPQL